MCPLFVNVVFQIGVCVWGRGVLLEYLLQLL